MLKSEKLVTRSSTGGPSHRSSSRIGRTRDESGHNRPRAGRVAFKTSNTPSLELEFNPNERFTPNTDFDDYLPEKFENNSTQRPDLSLKCPICGFYLDITELMDHRQLHAALAYFGFTDITTINIDLLNNKRNEVLKSYLAKYVRKSAKGLRIAEWNLKFSQLNHFYELLKCYAGNRFESNRQFKDANMKINTRGRCWAGPNDLVISIGSCSDKNQKYNTQMEDSSIVIEKFGGNPNFVYMGVFDGFDGDTASKQCESQFHLAVLDLLSKSYNMGECLKFDKEKFEFDEINHLEKFSTKSEQSEDTRSRLEEPYPESFKKAYERMDALLARGRGETSRLRWSGATACSLIIENRDDGGLIHLANCGDVEAILIYDNVNSSSSNRLRKNYKLLTKLHTINSCIKDRDLIERKGGKLFETSTGQSKLGGLYSITRGLGFHGDRDIKRFISSRPSVNSFKIEPNHAALVVATKGLWSVLHYEQVAQLVLQSLPSSRKIKPTRPTSPRVLALINNKEKLKDKSSLLHTVHDKEEGFVAHEMTELNESPETSIESNTIKKTFSVDDESELSEQQANEKSCDVVLMNSQYRRPRTAPNDQTRHEIENGRRCSSDIYPLKAFNSDLDEEFGLKIELRNMSIDKLAFKPGELTDEKTGEESVRRRLKPTSHAMVQVDEYELEKFARSNMSDREAARRLDLAESLSEMLVSAALIAGSTDNITVNCVLFPGSIVA